MRKIKYLIAALLLGIIGVSANPVEVKTAQKVAVNFYNRTYNANAADQTLAYIIRSDDGQPVFYVYNIDNNHGFVIVSAEDATIPVIGYSNEGPFVVPAAGNNVDFWLNMRKNEVAAIRTQKVAATSDITDKWTAYINNTPEKNTRASMSGVNPLCATTWDQPAPYNTMCPSNSLTGCVATAMAQIMKYWKYPSVGISYNCYYDNTAYGYQENYGLQCAYFDTSHYVWADMPVNLTNTSFLYQKKQVEKLMYDCGVAVQMDYSPTGSGSIVVGGQPSALYAYPNYFGYDQNKIQGLMYSSYTATAWQNLLKTELNNGRPVQYEGSDPSQGGHSWVCDGYNTASDFHMNWGWSGAEDGYFAVGSLNPSPYDFSQYVGAIMGIEPPTGLGVQNLTTNINLTVYPNPSRGIFTFEMPDNLQNAVLKIYNSLGQEVSSNIVNKGNFNVNLGNEAEGIYLYRLLNDNGQQISTGKLIRK